MEAIMNCEGIMNCWYLTSLKRLKADNTLSRQLDLTYIVIFTEVFPFIIVAINIVQVFVIFIVIQSLNQVIKVLRELFKKSWHHFKMRLSPQQSAWCHLWQQSTNNTFLLCSHKSAFTRQDCSCSM